MADSTPAAKSQPSKIEEEKKPAAGKDTKPSAQAAASNAPTAKKASGPTPEEEKQLEEMKVRIAEAKAKRVKQENNLQDMTTLVELKN